jgi:hypothetical protein
VDNIKKGNSKYVASILVNPNNGIAKISMKYFFGRFLDKIIRLIVMTEEKKYEYIIWNMGQMSIQYLFQIDI